MRVIFPAAAGEYVATSRIPSVANHAVVAHRVVDSIPLAMIAATCSDDSSSTHESTARVVLTLISPPQLLSPPGAPS